MKNLMNLLFIFLILGPGVNAQTTFPINDISNPKQDCYAFIHATIIKNPETTIYDASMVIRKGMIESVGTKLVLPNDAVVVDCGGKYIYPSFIDIFSDYGEPSVQAGSGFSSQAKIFSSTKGAFDWNQAIKTEFDAVKSFGVQDTRAKELRGIGFGTVLTQRMDGISRGTGAVVTLATEKENLVVLKERASANYSFDKGSSSQDYPGSLMGAIALLRQNYLDVQWYKSKPPEEGINLSLQAFSENQQLPQIFDANDKWNDLRADKIGREFGIQYILKGGGNEYQRVKEIETTHASFILPLNFPMAMDVEDPVYNRYISLAYLKNWEMAPSNPGVFEKANINFALTAYGLKDLNNFSGNLRKAIAAGLTERSALTALTQTPAKLAGIYDKIGSLEAGKIASFLIVSGPVFTEKTILFQNWIQGKKYIVKEDGWKDLRGEYALTINQKPYRLIIKGEPEKPAAEVIGMDTAKADLTVQGNLILMVLAFKKDSLNGASLNGIAMDSIWSGTGQNISGAPLSWQAVKKNNPLKKDTTVKKDSSVVKSVGVVDYPFGGYGSPDIQKPENLLIKNCTIWTSDDAGILTQSDLLIKNGKIMSVGKNLSDPTARIIDGTGKYLSPGIIDEHSHIAVTGGANECTLSVTPEVRIGDVIDPEDINIYRQLAGGVTSSHILHGSCNTIGGQTQLIKFRWGMNAEDMKFAGSDPFIKFALGENVKRSWSANNNRFPDSRMGVEELLMDAFTRTREYEKEGPGKRRDLKLEALAEILNQKRFITCHSYVQSEITMLMRVADTFHFRVNTFTHILEGYKVADKMKLHGANASTFSDWWGYKIEVVDAIPQNAFIMEKAGLNVAINSDDPEMATRLNQEAAKSVKYADMPESEAFKMVTINPAKMLHVDKRTGSIKPGKDADLVLWSDNPLSVYARAEKTIVDGIVYYDIEQDRVLREQMVKERARLIQKMSAAKKGGEKTIPAAPFYGQSDDQEDENQSFHSGDGIK
jgi:imidazolonepropionase-like amidohydrolase